MLASSNALVEQEVERLSSRVRNTCGGEDDSGWLCSSCAPHKGRAAQDVDGRSERHVVAPIAALHALDPPCDRLLVSLEFFVEVWVVSDVFRCSKAERAMSAFALWRLPRYGPEHTIAISVNGLNREARFDC